MSNKFIVKKNMVTVHFVGSCIGLRYVIGQKRKISIAQIENAQLSGKHPYWLVILPVVTSQFRASK